MAVAASVGLLAGVLVMSDRSPNVGQSKSSGQAPGSAARPEPESATDFAAIGLPAPSRETGHLIGGRPVTLAEAEATAGYRLARPDHELANDSNIRGVFIVVLNEDAPGSTHAVVSIDYESGILLIFHPASEGMQEGAAGAYEAEAAEMAPEVQVTTVNGAPALVIPKDTDADKANPSAVDLVLGEVEVAIYGQYASFDIATIVAVAETLK
jgi:hypothetical protein